VNAMRAALDFGIAGPLLAALAVCLLHPLNLWIVVRFPPLAGRQALQFLISVLVAAALWLGTVLAVPRLHPSGFADAAIALMALGAGALVYLEIWGLMSRGYTLSVLLTLHQAGRPLDAGEIAEGYRGGDGLDWIMRHRLAGLVAAGLVERRGDRLALTAVRGVLVARLYRLCVGALGLGAVR
jgi:hypothetical protein